MREIALDIGMGRLQDGRTALLVEPGGELGEVTPVTIQRVLRETVFQPQVVAEFVE
jgi:hypothetical protein